MEKMTSFLGYRLIPSPSYRQILFNWALDTLYYQLGSFLFDYKCSSQENKLVVTVEV